MKKTKNEKSFIISVIITLLLVSLCIGEAFAAKITKKDFIGNWRPMDPTAKNPFVIVMDDKNNIINMIIRWDQGLASHEGSQIKFFCEYDGKNTLNCKGKTYEYYPVRNGKRISSIDMTEEESLDENFPTKENLIEDGLNAKYILKKQRISIKKNPFTNKSQIELNNIILGILDEEGKFIPIFQK